MPRRSFNYQPIIVIGAARSGAVTLRDMLMRIDGIGGWEKDINPVWRHHNASTPHDEFTKAQATDKACRYIQDTFKKQAARCDSRLFIDSTAANSLRVEFVDTVLPNAKYIFVIRDGRDTVNSTLEQWNANALSSTLSENLSSIPWSDLPGYALRSIGDRLQRMISTAPRPSLWEPRLQEIDQLLASHPFDEVCAMQWQRSVQKADEALQEIDGDRVHVLRYEDLTDEPEVSLSGVFRFLEFDVDTHTRNEIAGGIARHTRGDWQQQMADEQRKRIETIIAPTLEDFGYAVSQPVIQSRAA